MKRAWKGEVPRHEGRWKLVRTVFALTGCDIYSAVRTLHLSGGGTQGRILLNTAGSCWIAEYFQKTSRYSGKSPPRLLSPCCSCTSSGPVKPALPTSLYLLHGTLYLLVPGTALWITCRTANLLWRTHKQAFWRHVWTRQSVSDTAKSLIGKKYFG